MSAVNKAAEQGHELPYIIADPRYAAHRRAVDAFFDHFHPDDTKEILWNWLSAVLGTDHPLFEQARNRANLLFFYEHLEKFIDAVYEWNKTVKAAGPRGEAGIGENTV